MNKKIFILIFLLFTYIFSSVSAETRHRQKGKKKATRHKVEQSKAKSATKAPERKQEEKAIAPVKIDTTKVKIRNIITEIDSLNNEKALAFKPYKKNAHASYYHNKFNGRRTASGLRFDNSKLTAAHKKFPFGTILRVTNEANGKSVIVEVTDRGPFSKAREIDLTRRAFMELSDNKNSGVVIVTIEVADPK